MFIPSWIHPEKEHRKHYLSFLFPFSILKSHSFIVNGYPQFFCQVVSFISTYDLSNAKLLNQYLIIGL